MRKNFTLIVLCVIVCACLMLPVSYIDKVNASENDTITLRYENKEWLYQDVFDNKNFANLFTMQERNVEWQNGKAKERIISYISEGQSVEEALSHYFPRFDAFYENIRCEIEQEYKEPTIFYEPMKNSWNFEKECVGKKIDANDMLYALLSGQKEIELKVQTIVPKMSAQTLSENTILRSKEKTTFAGSESGRRFNIAKALKCFNGLVVMPDEKVSFQDVVNKNDDGQPYKEAVVIVNGQFTKGLGGGICQASTTIYNAALMAGLEIISVHHHSLPVGYVQKGFDAMVNDSGVDLVFRNNTNFPVYFKAYTYNNFAYAEVYGQSLNGIEYKKLSKQIEVIEPPNPKIVPDNELKYIDKIKYKGEYFTERYAQYGYKISAYLEVYENGKLKETRYIRTNTYSPTQSIIYEGVQEKKMQET